MEQLAQLHWTPYLTNVALCWFGGVVLTVIMVSIPSVRNFLIDHV